MRFFLYSHDGIGLGHVRRHLAIASAIVKSSEEATVLVATSVDEVSRLGLCGRVDTLKLPALRKVANNQYNSRRLGVSSPEIHELRSALLRKAVESFRPAVVLADKHPLGASGEFQAALQSAKALGARAVLGLRDILDDRATVDKEWSADCIREHITDYYDMVLIYGLRSVFDPMAEYQLPSGLLKRTKYCGYVLGEMNGAVSREAGPAFASEAANGTRRILCTAGGGEDGFDLLAKFIMAAAKSSWRGLAVAGPMLDRPRLDELVRLAEKYQVEFHTFVPCLSNYFQKVDGLVCMGGYNTLVEAAASGVPTLCVPRSSPRSEQLMRAQVFERLGLLRYLHPNHVTVESLRENIQTIINPSRKKAGKKFALKFDGARRSAEHLLRLADDARPRENRLGCVA